MPSTTEGGKVPFHSHETAQLQTCAKRDGAPLPHPISFPSILDRRTVAVPADSLISPCIQTFAKNGS